MSVSFNVVILRTIKCTLRIYEDTGWPAWRDPVCKSRETIDRRDGINSPAHLPGLKKKYVYFKIYKPVFIV